MKEGDVYAVKVKKVKGAPEPDTVQGTCTCGETGPETTDKGNATLWCVGHNDGHKAYFRSR